MTNPAKAEPAEDIRSVFESLHLATAADRANFVDMVPRQRRQLQIIVSSTSEPFGR